MIRMLAALALMAGGAAAEAAGPLPALHDVAGVAAGDALTVRAMPDPSAQIVAELPADARDVEVVETAAAPSGAPWARVALPEGGGWVAARHLVRQGGQDDPDRLPPLVCAGTEPGWTLELGAGEIASLAMPGFEPAPAFVTRRTRSANDPRSHGFTARWDGPHGDPATFGITGAPVTGIVRRAACSDGMSDRPYGFAAEVIAGTLEPDGRAGAAHLSGCCRVRPPG